MGKLLLCTSSVRLLLLTLMPASESKAIVSSKRRPFDCTAILNMLSFII